MNLELSQAILTGLALPPETILVFTQPSLRIPSAGDALVLACCATGTQLKYSAVMNRWPWLKKTMNSPCKCPNLVTPNALLVLLHLIDSHPDAYTPKELAQLVANLEHMPTLLLQ